MTPKKERPGRKLTLEEDGRRLHIYSKAGSDREAAVLCGVTQRAWHHWRRIVGLPPKNRGPCEDGRRLRLWSRAKDDVDAAARAGMSYQDWRNWRRKAGLPRRGGRNLDSDAPAPAVPT